MPLSSRTHILMKLLKYSYNSPLTLSMMLEQLGTEGAYFIILLLGHVLHCAKASVVLHGSKTLLESYLSFYIRSDLLLWGGW